VSWFARIRKAAVLGAVLTTGLVAGAFLSVGNAKARKDKASPTGAHPDAGAADAKPAPAKAQPRRKQHQPDPEQVRRAQPVPRDYVE
jgi:hypothetical protein